MVTLLLTFFVMLLSLAQTQNPELFKRGKDSFLKSVRNIGLGIFWSRAEMPRLGNIKIKHYISNPDESVEHRSIDAKGEQVRRILAELPADMSVTRSQIVSEKTSFSVTNIRFGAGEATLNEPARKFLREFCYHLQESGTTASKLYVLGLASDAPTEKQQWILSARRAQVVAEFLQDSLSGAYQAAIYSWGAGPGGDWVSRDSPISEHTHILLAVLR